MNNILLNKNRYTNIAFGNTNKHSEINYRLFTNKIKLKQKNYINILITFINVFNTFITEKFKDEKDLWLIVNDNQTTNLNVLDARDKIYDISAKLDEIEARLTNLESNKGFQSNCNWLYMNLKEKELTTGLFGNQSTNSLIQQLYTTNIKNQSTGIYLMQPIVKLKFSVPHDIILQFGLLTPDSQMEITLSI